MGRSQQTFSKIEKEKKKLKKREEKQKRKEERKANSKKGSGFDNMIAYVDENGHLSDTPPDLSKKKKIKAENIEIAIPKKEHVEEDPIKKGRVAFFNDSKGYGFITEQESQEKYFVHVNGLMQEVKEGDKVTFELEMGMKGLNAVRVKKQ